MRPNDGRSPKVSRRQVLGAAVAGAVGAGLGSAVGGAGSPLARAGRGVLADQWAADRRSIDGPPEAALAGATTWSVPAGNGTAMRITSAPFALALLDRSGAVTVSTVPSSHAGLAGGPGVPAVGLAAPELDGPEPVAPLGSASSSPGIGFVTGLDGGVAVPSATYWMGNRLLGANGGLVVPLVAVASARPSGGGWELQVVTGLPDAGTATVSVLPVADGGVAVTVLPPAALGAAATIVSLQSPVDEALYGLGGRKDAFDQRGLLRTLWCDQENVGAGPLTPATGAVLGSTYTFPNGPQASYYVQALLFGSRGWAAWVGQTSVGELDLAVSEPDVVRWATAGSALQLWLAGGGLEAASAAYTSVAGRAPAPPSWAYLPWMDVINQQSEGDAAPDGSGFTGGAAVAARVRTVVGQCAATGIPLGVVGMEGWQAVPGVGELAGELRAAGLHLSAYWNPFIAPTSPAYQQAADAGVLVGSPLGRPDTFLDTRGNPTALVDFTNPAAVHWWAGQLDRSMALGFEGFMHDFGEQVSEPMTFHDGQPPSTVHNAYPVLYHHAARAAVDAFAAAHPGFAPFFYVRSGFSAMAGPGTAALAGAATVAGTTASTPGVFPGDETTDWTSSSGIASVVPAMLNLALGGAFAFTTDVGGYLDLYTPRTTAELFTRWSQLAAMTAITRIHNSTVHGSVYPWDFDAATLDTYRRYARAKVRLAPLVDAWARRAATTGVVGPVRPVVLVDPSPTGRAVADQWLLGDELLVAPVLVEGATDRAVYLPAGASWQQVTVGEDGAFVGTGRVSRGGTTVVAPAPLADIPLFVRVPA